MSALGTEYKINVHMKPIDGIHMANDNVDFECTLYVNSSRSVTFKKGDEAVKKIDNDNYKIVVSSEQAMKIGRGAVKMKFTAHIEDPDFPDYKRTEIVDNICTGVTIT
ncbi:MAG: hypothetical protein U0L26_01865 [Cellulosilyticum sp.]|nr:hypothetical protein [Cellulosilyticum sp.]